MCAAASKPAVAPCWITEEFFVSEACFRCSDFISVRNHRFRNKKKHVWSLQTDADVANALLFQKTQLACRQTGYIEKVNCTKSNKDDYKRFEMERVW